MEASPVVHPSEKTLSSYGLGQLDDHQAETVNRHLKDCAACQSRVAEMNAGIGLVPLAPLTDVPAAVLPQLVGLVAERINAELRPRAAKLWTTTYLWMG